MAYFECAQDMVIDDGPIDADHRRLIAQVNELHTATSQGQGHSVVGQLLEQLLADTAEHLRQEERQMQQAGYPHMERHRMGHDRFEAELRALQAKYQSGSITVASQLSTLLRDWLSLHIRRNDKELRQFLQTQRRSPRRTSLERVHDLHAGVQARNRAVCVVANPRNSKAIAAVCA